MRKNKTLLFLVVFLLGVGWLALSVAQANVTISLWKASHGADLEVMPGILQAFEEANPGIKVDFLSHPWEGWDERYGVAFAAGDPPDVSYMPDEFWPRFAEAGLLARFDQLFPKDVAILEPEFPEAFWRLTTYKGHQYAVPFLWVAIAMFYNRDLFEEAGLTVPPSNLDDPALDEWTWETFVDVAQKLTLPEQDQWGFSWSAAFRDPNYLYPFFYQAGTDVLDLENNRAAFYGPEGVAALQFIVDLVHTYQVIPVEGMHPDFHQIFFEGKAALAPVESYSVPIIRSQFPDLNVGVTFKPQGPGVDFFGGRGTFGNSGYWVMSEACQEKEAAWELIKWLSNRESVQQFNDAVGLFGARKDFVPDPDEPLYRVFFESQRFMPGYPLHPQLRQVHSIVMAEVQNAVLLAKTPEQAIRDASEAVNALLQE
ncbi:MAG TPA: sugar ABC transporter substrate-binding protein [Atribacteraceae bacterium]|nr:sugar ABC transporter substrate-binding protein [Atribacteraceae bacterium]